MQMAKQLYEELLEKEIIPEENEKELALKDLA
jgi:hypothetical protein